MFTKEYWNDRAIKVGHTGHSEPFYYCFDQTARLYAINQVLTKLSTNKNAALDFGCGSGDFLHLLIPNYTTVVGYDISDMVVKQASDRFKNCHVILTSSFNELDKYRYDLILSISVLQCLNKTALNTIVQSLSKLLSKGGKMISMDFFPSDNSCVVLKEDKTSQTDWLNILKSNGLIIKEQQQFYNPVINPSKSWYWYNYNPVLRLLSLVKHHSIAQKIFRYTAKKLITYFDDVLITEGNCNIYIIEKMS
jgi:SAM-dependent methyltransferase